MDEMKLSPDRIEVLKKIEQYEREGRFDEDVENDPEAPELLPDQVDYLCEKFFSKVSRRIANFVADHYFLKLIKQDKLVIDEVRGEEHLHALKNGAIVTCNHFHAYDNYVVFHCIRKALPRKYLYKVIREGNYTNPPKPFGLLMRHCNTLPLSSRMATMKKFLQATKLLLERGETILIYPEQGMWWNYKKPRPMQDGAFSLAVRNGVPVVPIFITMEDSDVPDGEGFFVQEYTLHILPAIYPEKGLPRGGAEARMKEENYAAWVKVYEEFYKKPLVYF